MAQDSVIQLLASGLERTVQLTTRDSCDSGIEDNSAHMGARISTIFVILATSGIGTFLPILASKYSFIRLPKWVFFLTKYFGSGVIFATGFIHLLQPSDQLLETACLGGVWVQYPMAYAFMMISFFILFLFEIVSAHYVEMKLQAVGADGQAHTHSHFGDAAMFTSQNPDDSTDEIAATKNADDIHESVEEDVASQNSEDRKKFINQFFAIMVLEFGVIFHSVFVGISLAIAGEEFTSLYIVLVFHQMFEGLGLGTRIAQTAWPSQYKLTPWIMACAYTLTTPIAIAIGLGVRTSYPPGSSTALIVNGIFDSISAGILIYTAIVELVAHEFLFSQEFKGPKRLRNMLCAYAVMATGTGLMALLGKWA